MKTEFRSATIDHLLVGEIHKIIAPVAACCLYVTLVVLNISGLFNWTKSANRTTNEVPGRAYFYPNGVRLITEELEIIESQRYMSWEFLGETTVLVLVCLGLLALVTAAILLAVYMRCFRCLTYYFYLPTFLVLILVTPIVFRLISVSLNGPDLDLITVALVVWNFAFLGMVSIFGIFQLRAPMLMNQIYLISNASTLAVMLVVLLPGWVPYILLICLLFWDTFAVLSPCGPLKLLIEMAQEVGLDQMPGLTYSTQRNNSGQLQNRDQLSETLSVKTSKSWDPPLTPMDGTMSLPTSETAKNVATKQEIALAEPLKESGPHDTSGTTEVSTSNKPRLIVEEKSRPADKVNYEPLISDEEGSDLDGLDMGLGDFVFYGLLSGLAARDNKAGDHFASLAVILAILFGAILTLLCLAVSDRPVPAIPISISLGLLVLSATTRFAPGLANQLSHQQVFV